MFSDDPTELNRCNEGNRVINDIGDNPVNRPRSEAAYVTAEGHSLSPTRITVDGEETKVNCLYFMLIGLSACLFFLFFMFLFFILWISDAFFSLSFLFLPLLMHRSHFFS